MKNSLILFAFILGMGSSTLSATRWNRPLNYETRHGSLKDKIKKEREASNSAAKYAFTWNAKRRLAIPNKKSNDGQKFQFATIKDSCEKATDPKAKKSLVQFLRKEIKQLEQTYNEGVEEASAITRNEKAFNEENSKSAEQLYENTSNVAECAYSLILNKTGDRRVDSSVALLVFEANDLNRKVFGLIKYFTQAFQAECSENEFYNQMAQGELQIQSLPYMIDCQDERFVNILNAFVQTSHSILATYEETLELVKQTDPCKYDYGRYDYAREEQHVCLSVLKVSRIIELLEILKSKKIINGANSQNLDLFKQLVQFYQDLQKKVTGLKEYFTAKLAQIKSFYYFEDSLENVIAEFKMQLQQYPYDTIYTDELVTKISKDILDEIISELSDNCNSNCQALTLISNEIDYNKPAFFSSTQQLKSETQNIEALNKNIENTYHLVQEFRNNVISSNPQKSFDDAFDVLLSNLEQIRKKNQEYRKRFINKQFSRKDIDTKEIAERLHKRFDESGRKIKQYEADKKAGINVEINKHPLCDRICKEIDDAKIKEPDNKNIRITLKSMPYLYAFLMDPISDICNLKGLPIPDIYLMPGSADSPDLNKNEKKDNDIYWAEIRYDEMDLKFFFHNECYTDMILAVSAHEIGHMLYATLSTNTSESQKQEIFCDAFASSIVGDTIMLEFTPLYSCVHNLNYILNFACTGHKKGTEWLKNFSRNFTFFDPQNLPALVNIVYALHSLIINKIYTLTGNKKGVGGTVFLQLFSSVLEEVKKKNSGTFTYLTTHPEQDEFVSEFIQITLSFLENRENDINAYITQSIKGYYHLPPLNLLGKFLVPLIVQTSSLLKKLGFNKPIHPAEFDRYNLARDYCKIALENGYFEWHGKAII